MFLSRQVVLLPLPAPVTPSDCGRSTPDGHHPPSKNWNEWQAVCSVYSSQPLRKLAWKAVSTLELMKAAQ